MAYIPPTTTPEKPPLPPAPLPYATFSVRALAFSVDQFLLLMIMFVITLPLILLLGLGTFIAWPFITIFVLPPTLPVTTIIAWLYFAGQESSRHQATFGKRLCGLTVTDMQGQRISFVRATVRFFGKFLSSAIMLVGFIMAAFTERHQALHDLIADTVVIDRTRRKN